MEIGLSQGQAAVVDDGDAELALVSWCAHKPTGAKTFYAVRNVRGPDGNWTTEYMHQVIARRMGILGAPDHRDRNGLNNRRDNLRPDPHGRANANRVGWGKSGLKGVIWCERLGKWRAQIKANRKQRHLGYFVDPIEAAKAYDRAALEAFGEFALLNFPSPEITTPMESTN